MTFTLAAWSLSTAAIELLQCRDSERKGLGSGKTCQDEPARTNPNPKKVHLMALVQWPKRFYYFLQYPSKKAEGSMMRKSLRDFSVQVLEEDLNEI